MLGDNTASKERQVIKFLMGAGDNGKALGLTALQTSAIGAAAISAGKEAEVAATSFNAFATKLGDAKGQGKDFQQGLRTLGLSARQVKADLARNPFEALMKVFDQLDKLAPDRKLKVANKLFGFIVNNRRGASIGV